MGREFIPNERTKAFINEVKKLKEAGVIHTDKQLSKRIEYSPANLSNVFGGRRDIPLRNYLLFKETFQNISRGNIKEAIAPMESATNDAIISIADSNKELVLTNKIIATANYDLVLMLKNATADASSEKKSGLPSTKRAAQELLSLARQGKLSSIEEVDLVLKKYIVLQ